MKLIKITLGIIYLILMQTILLLAIPFVIIFYIYCYLKYKKHGKEKNRIT